jgi:2-polyprenyl-3-methyl-5-hydroxy-6-metoxy-1,4-benzoquinol methylase
MTNLKTLIANYPNLSWRDRLHMIIRWRLCPMQRLAGVVPQQGIIVDLGCGHGLFTQLLACDSENRSVIGIDLDAHKITVAQQLALPTLQFIVGDIAACELPAAQAVTILDVFYLIPYAAQEQLLGVCAAKLAADGVIILKDMAEKPRWKVWLNQLEETLAVRILNITLGESHFYFRPRAEWQAVFHRLGFEVETIPLDRGYYHPHVVFIARKKQK